MDPKFPAVESGEGRSARFDAIGIFVLASAARLAVLRPSAPATPSEEAMLAAAYAAGHRPIGDPANTDLVRSLLSWIQPIVAGGRIESVSDLSSFGEQPIVHGSRLLFALLGALAPALLCRAGRRLASRGAGLVAGGLLALLPAAVALSSQIGEGSLLIFSSAGAALSLVALMRSPRLAWAAAFGASVGFGAAGASGAVAFLGALPFALRRKPESDRTALVVFVFLALGFALAAPGAIVAWAVRPDLTLGARPEGSPLLEGAQSLFHLAGPASIALALVGVAGVFAAKHAPSGAVLAGSFAAFLGILLREGAQPETLAFLLPPTLLLAAFGASRESRLPGPIALRRALVGVAFAMALFGWTRTLLARWERTAEEEASEWVRRNLPNEAPLLAEFARFSVPAVEGKAEREKLAEAGKLPRERVEQYAPAGKAFQPLALYSPGLSEGETVLRYDPTLTRYFRWTLLEEGAYPSWEREQFESFHARVLGFLENHWRLAARFEAKSPNDLTISIYERPDDFSSADLEATELGEDDGVRTLLLLLRDRSLIAVRDTSRAHRDWLLRGGKILRSSGELAGALEFLGRAAETDPKDAEIRFQMGLVQLIAENREAAKANFLAGMVQDPEHGGIHFNLATILEEEGDLLGSEVEYRAATLHLEDPTPAHARLGGVLVQLGRIDEAREELARVRRLAPGSDAEQYLSRALSTP